MNKKQFINELERNIKGLSKEDREEIIRDYEEHFEIGKKKGRKEEEISISLGDPRQLAKQAKIELLVSKAEEKKSVRNIFRMILATIGMGFFNLIFVVGIFCALFGVIIAFFVAGFAIVLSGLVLIIVAFLPTIDLFYIPAFNSVSMFFGGITLISFGMLFTIGTYYLGKGFSSITIKYVKLNIKIVKGSKK